MWSLKKQKQTTQTSVQLLEDRILRAENKVQLLNSEERKLRAHMTVVERALKWMKTNAAIENFSSDRGYTFTEIVKRNVEYNSPYKKLYALFSMPSPDKPEMSPENLLLLDALDFLIDMCDAEPDYTYEDFRKLPLLVLTELPKVLENKRALEADIEACEHMIQLITTN
jgi:hypothetical protein